MMGLNRTHSQVSNSTTVRIHSYPSLIHTHYNAICITVYNFIHGFSENKRFVVFLYHWDLLIMLMDPFISRNGSRRRKGEFIKKVFFFTLG